MNLSELKKLKTGDKIRFAIPPPNFKLGESYLVEETNVGKVVINNRGRKYFLFDALLYESFERVK